MEDFNDNMLSIPDDILIDREEVKLPYKFAGKGDLKNLFAEFTCLTPQQRMEVFGFSLQKEFAVKYDVTTKTLAQWKKDPRFEKLKKKLYLERVDKRLPQVIDRMVDRAIEGDVGAGKEILKVAGLSVERMEITTQNQINVLMIGIIESINTHIKDQDVIDAIADDLERLAGDIE